MRNILISIMNYAFPFLFFYLLIGILEPLAVNFFGPYLSIIGKCLFAFLLSIYLKTFLDSRIIRINEISYAQRRGDKHWTIHLRFCSWLIYNRAPRRKDFLINELFRAVEILFCCPHINKVSTVTWLIQTRDYPFWRTPQDMRKLARKQAFFPAVTAAAGGVVANLASFRRPNIKPLRSPWHEITWVRAEKMDASGKEDSHAD